MFNCSRCRGRTEDSSWYGKKALSPDGELHHCLKPAACDKMLPTPDTLLFGTGSQVLADTRFGDLARYGGALQPVAATGVGG